MLPNYVPQVELMGLYLDALAQLSSGYKRQLSEEAIALFAMRNKESNGTQESPFVFTRWCKENPELVFEYTPLTKEDITRLNAFMVGASRLINKWLPDLKAVDFNDTSERLSPQDKARKIANIFRDAGVPDQKLQTFLQDLNPPEKLNS